MDLDEVHGELVFDLRELAALVATSASAVDLGDTFDELCDKFEALGLCHLLEFGDIDVYRMNLVRSAQARRYLLDRMRIEGTLSDRHLGLSRTRAIFSALAGGSLSVARQVVERSVEIFDPNWEYEDDHCYFLALHRFLQQAPLPAGLLARFEVVLEGAESPRLDILQALSLRDRESFVVGLKKLLEAEDEAIEAARDSAAVHEGDLLHWPNSFVSIEGLGLLQLAEWMGLDVAQSDDTLELERLPGLARVPLDEVEFEDLLEQVALLD